MSRATNSFASRFYYKVALSPAMCTQKVCQYVCGCKANIGNLIACPKKGTKDCKEVEERLIGYFSGFCRECGK